MVSFDRLQRTLEDQDRITSFDFVRSMAALSVIITHFEIVDTLQIDIDAFFVLSGFLITSFLYQDERPQRIQRFLVNRLTKILPSYFAFMIISFVIGKLLFDHIYQDNLPLLSEWKQYFFFYRNYGGLPHRWSFEHLWTISVEEHFYFSILLIAFILGSVLRFRKWITTILIVFLFTSITAKFQANFTDFAEYPTYTHNRFDAFCYGGMLFVYRDKLINLKILKSVICPIFVMLGFALLILLDTGEHYLWMRTFSPALLVLSFVYLKQFRFPPFFTILAYYSYNAYLWHNVLVVPIEYYFDFSVLGFTVYLVLTTLLAFLSTHWVEDYFIEKRGNLINALNKISMA